ncbi:MAG: MG2 domain-containing protein [Anaerolineae bacterium]
MTDSHVSAELLAYLDGELTDEERRRVEEHLASCATCTAELARLRELRAAMKPTLDATIGSMRLSYEADERIRQVLRERLERRERVPWWQFWRWRGLVAQAVLALLIVAFSVSTFTVMSLPAPPPAQRTLILGESRLAPGSRAALRVVVRSVAGPAVAMSGSPIAGAKVVVGLRAPSGETETLFNGETDAQGTADVTFEVPPSLQGEAELVVETTSEVGRERVVRVVELVRPHKIYLMSDKPAYRPGQPIRVRALVLDALDLHPVSRGHVAWAIADPQGADLASGTAGLSDYGVTHWSVTLPEDAAKGTYILRASLGETTSERSVLVADYTLPPFDVELATTRSFYAPGDEVAGEVKATYFFGRSVVDAEVVLRAYTEARSRHPVLELRGATGTDGVYRFAFVLPEDIGSDGATFALEAEVTDSAGQRSGIRQTVPVSPAPILIRAVPESGLLKPGVENRVYLMTSYPDGRPAPTTLTVTVEGDEAGMPNEVETGPYGLAVVRLVPRQDTLLDVAARDPDGLAASASLLLPVDEAPEVLLLHVDRAAYVAGDTLLATALVSGEDVEAVYLDVVQAGQMVAALSAPVADGQAAFALDLDPAMVGALQLRAYALTGDAPDTIEDTRLVVVDPPQALDVTVAADQERYAPGDVARLEIDTARREGVGGRTAVPAALGISVVDVSVFALETLPPSFARTYFLVSEAMLEQRSQVAGLDLPTLLEAQSERRDAQDIAARAAWADVPVPGATLKGEAILTPQDEGAAARQNVARALTVVLGALPVVLSVVVGRQMRRLGLLGSALKRLGWALLVLTLLSPLLVAGLVVGLLLPTLGALLFVGALVVALVLLVLLVAESWRSGHAALQIFTGVLITHLVLGGLLLGLTARDAGPGLLGTALIVATFFLLIITTIAEGQTLVLARQRRTGWLATALALVLVLLALAAPAVPSLASDLSRAVGNPSLYVGPVGWLSGCAGATPVSQAVEVTEGPAAEEEAVPEMAPTPPQTQAPLPTGTPAFVPAEPYPLRHVFPETLYWDPAAETGVDGRLALDLPLADTLTAWRVTALASTSEGEIGAASIDVAVFQPLFTEVSAPDEAWAGDPVTLTLTVYNFDPHAERVRWRTPPEEGFEELMGPVPVDVLPERGATTVWVIRPTDVGTLPLIIEAVGENAVDRVLVEIEVREP